MSKKLQREIALARDQQDQNNLLKVEKETLDYLQRTQSIQVSNLYQSLKSTLPDITEADMVDAVWRLAKRGAVNVEDLPATGWRYLTMWERSMWFYVVVVGSLAASICALTIPANSAFVSVRWLMGSCMLFFPGYATVQCFFLKSKEFNNIERFALSIGLSLTLFAMVGFLLSYTPWGITLISTVTALSGLTILVSLIGLARRFFA